MARTETKQIPLGYTAPDFELYDVISGKKKTLVELKSAKATVVIFICNHCPFVKHVADGIAKLADDYIPKGVSFVAINSNDIVKHPDDAPDKMVEFAGKHKFPFPYLYDETQDIARAYDAACTPDFSIFDETMNCVYRGQLDDSRPDSGIPVSGKDIRNALDALLSEKPVNPLQKPSIGCNIKWK